MGPNAVYYACFHCSQGTKRSIAILLTAAILVSIVTLLALALLAGTLSSSADRELRHLLIDNIQMLGEAGKQSHDVISNFLAAGKTLHDTGRRWGRNRR